jgi:peptidoglycan hydrolase-like protein with peptidoglycan-binding domain
VGHAQEVREQEFVLTAYYSPEPGQCCYVKGGLHADRVLNGQGIAGADGTAVYPGMIAAPPTYAFGTRVALPGLGVLTVHDRGGAIQEWEGGVHRLDVWVGSGEEGLARALAFGVQRMRGTVYPPGTSQPNESFSLDALPAPTEKLTHLSTDDSTLIGLSVQEGDATYSVRILQQSLAAAGYFQRSVTGFFGAETKTSLERFLTDYGVGESAASLTDRTAAFLQSAVARIGARPPIDREMGVGSTGSSVAAAQRLLRFLGYYRGRTDAVYGDTLADSVLRFQQDHGLVGTATDPGAGRIGPMTKTALTAAWNRKLVTARAERELMLARIDATLASRGAYIDQFLSEGDGGTQVTLLQQLLAEREFFPQGDVNGHFGPLTKSALLAYQIDRSIVTSAADVGAGVVGPRTLEAFQNEEKRDAYLLVRAKGWSVL